MRSWPARRPPWGCLARRSILEKATAIWEETGDRRGLAYYLYEIGGLQAKLGERDRAMRTWERALREQRAIDLPYQSLVLIAMGLLEAECGRTESATQLVAKPWSSPRRPAIPR